LLEGKILKDIVNWKQYIEEQNFICDLTNHIGLHQGNKEFENKEIFTIIPLLRLLWSTYTFAEKIKEATYKLRKL
jgi:hypothetical protein